MNILSWFKKEKEQNNNIELIFSERKPTSQDHALFGTMWIYKNGIHYYVQTSKKKDDPSWNIVCK